MSHLNVEIKARCSNPHAIRNYLQSRQAELRGVDHQVDTYFNVQSGRLKLREGNIENNLIYYERTNAEGPKESHFELLQVPDPGRLKKVLEKSIGVKAIVDKKREIWFIENVKFHIDEVPGLGNFVEIEASNLYKGLTKEELQKQCDFYLNELGIRQEDLVAESYSDMLMAGVI